MTHPRKGIVFDFDGTLANSLTEPMGAYRHAFESVNLSLGSDHDVRQYFGTGADRIFAKLVADPVLANSAFQSYLQYQQKNVSSCNWHTGIKDLLDLIEKNHIPTAIVTGRHSADLEIVASRLGLNRHFLHQICDDHLKQSKPDPEGIFLAANRLGLLPSELIYVGDSKGDLDAAHAAGALAVAALWDETMNRELLTAHADEIAETPKDVWRIFNESRDS